MDLRLFLSPLLVVVGAPLTSPLNALAQSWGADLPSIARGHRTEAHLHAYDDRFNRLYETLSGMLRDAAPDLLAQLSAPEPSDLHGYGLLPTIVPDAPPPSPGTKSRVAA